MYVNEERRVVYLAQPRTGSHSVASALMEQRGFRRLRGHHASTADLIEAKVGYTADSFKGWAVLSTVRNHFDALVSWYKFRFSQYGKPAFDLPFIYRLFSEGYIRVTGIPLKYAGDPPPFEGGRGELYWKYLPETTHVLRYERLAEDLNDALAECKVGPVELPRLNVSGGKETPFQSFYKPRTRLLVATVFAEEIERLGYGFGETIRFAHEKETYV